MKSKSIILAGLVTILSLAFVSVNAQLASEPAVKILPTNEQGILKVLYAYDTDQSVEVRFLDDDGLITSDKIKAAKTAHGFSKKYNVRNIKSGTFWIEVKAANVSVIYKVTGSSDGKAYTSALEKATFNYPSVASIN